MLVLSRKKDERIWIGPDIAITVVAVAGNRVRLGIDAPPAVKVLRDELTQAVEENEDHGET